MYRGFTAAALALAATSIALAAPAAADNQSYLNAVSSLTTPTGTDGLLQVGKGACSLLKPNNAMMFGRAPNAVATIVWESNPQLERHEATLLVNAAIDHLCPGVNPWGHAT